MPIQTISGPTSEPVTLAEAKTHLNLRQSFTTHDDMITALIQAAREWCEQYTGRAFAPRTVTEYWDCWPRCYMELQKSPVAAVSGIQYYADDTGLLTTWAASAYYTDLVSEPARIVYNDDISLPSLDDRPNAVQTTYVTGYASISSVPAAIKQAMLLMVGFWYENREDMPTNETNNPRIRSAHALLNPFKVFV